MSTRKLFEEDVMQKECGAEVTNCVPLKKGYGVELDQTVFFPEGGGQLSDVGYLELQPEGKKVQVLHTSEKDGHIYHETAEPVQIGTEVHGVLDWQTRFDHMQQHCGEHMLSYAFWKLFDADNIGFHMTPEMVTIDLNVEVTPEQIRQAEQFTNQQIQENHAVTAKWMTKEEAEKLTTRKFNEKLTGPIRIVHIEGGDACTCCGTHPPMTGMVGLVKVFKAEKHKTGTRVHFLCGRLALQAISERLDALTDASNELSIKDVEIADGVARLQEEIKGLKEQLHADEQELIAARVQKLLQETEEDEAGNLPFKIVSTSLTPAAAKDLAKQLAEQEKASVAIFYENKGRVNYILALGTGAAGSCRTRIKAINEALNGRGGGRDEQAQGSAPAQENWQELIKDL